MYKLRSTKTATERILSRQKVRYHDKLTPERLQILFRNVNVFSKRLSPINCSRNIMAAMSDIDKEIEYAKKQASLSPVSTKRSECYSVSSTRSKILSHRAPSPNINTSLSFIRSKSPSNSRNSNKKPKLSIIPNRPKTSLTRHAKIKNLMTVCKMLKSNISEIANDFNQMMKDTKNGCKAIVNVVESTLKNSIEKRLISLENQIFEPIKNNLELELKITKALKRGKKVWKLKHITFMKYIDRIIYSVNSRKKV